MSPSENNQLRGLYELYALGLLEEPERSEIEEEIHAGSTEARKRLREAMENNAILIANIPLVEPPQRLRKRVLAIAGAETRNWTWMVFWGAVTAGLLGICVYLGMDSQHKVEELASVKRQLQQTLTQSAQSNSELLKARQVLSFLNAAETRVVTFGPKDPKPPHGRVLINKERGVLLVASNLPPAPAGKIYEMWILRKGQPAPAPAGLFQSNEAGTALHIQEGAVPQDVAVAVTLEPESGSTTPTMPILFVAGA